eukprot:TRINITY_DN24170_c0_g1_i1.p1 TRINITY_DN24170_c0_g1~~TRINITY_DN24170_c0_g1_i1.p1  ORF type:complete len:389 (+),score=54.73 TRINITY_DN24170_c0_g1_i1:111-1169(+)
MPRGDGMCGDFQRGTCTRGKDCKYAHGMTPRLLAGSGGGFRGDGVCGDFQRGQCTRGSECRYSHGSASVSLGLAQLSSLLGAAQSVSADSVLRPAAGGGFRGDGTCGDFIRGVCTRGTECRYSHSSPKEAGHMTLPLSGFRGDGACGDYQKGVCTRGADCRYSHILPGEPVNAVALAAAALVQQATVQQAAQAQLIAAHTAAAAQAQAQMPLLQTPMLPYRGDGLCGDFFRGACTRGTDCKYSHTSSTEQLIRPAAGGGFRGDGICGDFLRGTCTRGTECKYLHAQPDESISAAAAAQLLQAHAAVGAAIGGFRGDGICGDFQAGRCNRGADCRYRHPGSSRGLSRSRSPRR